MSVEIVNKELYENRDEDEIWLHRYFSSKHLIDTFQQGCFKIRFKRVDSFGDGLEGWNHSIPNIKKVVKILVGYTNRISGEVEILPSLTKHVINLTKEDGDIIDDELVLENIKERELNFASCWFASDSKDYESRVMWNLYSGINRKEKEVNTGVKISVKWIELKAALEKLDENFEVGFVDYSKSKNMKEVMFKKDSSYSFEEEFRILIKTSNNKKRVISKIIDPFSSPTVYCKVWDSHDNTEAIKKVLELGFDKNKNGKRRFTVSDLIPEIKGNWSERE